MLVCLQYHKFMFIYITVHLWIMQYPKIKHIVFHDAVNYIYMKYVTTCDTCYLYKIYTAYNTQSLWIQIPPENGLNPPNRGTCKIWPLIV